MERFLFRKIEVWVLGVLLVAGLLAMVVFGMLVRNRALGHDKFGTAGEIAYNIASIPATAKDILDGKNQMLAFEDGTRFLGMSGWALQPRATELAGAGYILLSRFDGDLQRAVVELVDTTNWEIAHRWQVDAKTLFAGMEVNQKFATERLENETFRIIHPLLLESGDLLIKDHYSPLARIDACGGKVWTINSTFHHSSELGVDGTIWIPGSITPSSINWARKPFNDDSITQISADGQILSVHSVVEILRQNGYEYLVAGMGNDLENEPIHLNDIQPVISDGEFWKKGDVFLSIRNKSTILLFRPSTNEIIWLKSGPWIYQHDVDIVGEGKIAIFNNGVNPQAFVYEEHPPNSVMVYDFRTDQVTKMHPAAFEREKIHTMVEGLYTVLPTGHLMVEEENYGRLLFIAPDDQVVAAYVNGASDGLAYRMGWSRFIPKKLGDMALTSVTNASCDSSR